MRAVADDQQAAMTMGISVRRIFAMAWALAAVSALIAGVSSVTSRRWTRTRRVRSARLPGCHPRRTGLGPGTIIGGLTMGLLAQFVSGYLDPGLATVIPYIVLVLILLVRPYGILGETRIERV